MTRLEQLRLDAGLSPKELARKAEVNWKTVTALEKGTNTKPHTETRIKLAAALHAKPSELLQPAVWSNTEVPA